MTRRIFVIRHGNTFASGQVARRIGAGTDLSLVDSGMVQAGKLGQWFADRAFPGIRIFSGPLLRARQTAQAIAAGLSRPVDGVLPWLNEIDHGPDEGLPEAEVVARIGEAAITAWDRQGVAPDGWRVDADARLRAWRDWFAQGEEGTDLLVTSNGSARFALLALGLPTDALKLRTGALGELHVDEAGRVSMTRWDERP